jgi:hypothetical protein
VAVVGTAIAEYDVKNFYHPHTFAGEYIKEVVLSSLCALFLGWFVYYKWRPPTAKWIWISGVCYFAWRIGVRLAPTYVVDWDPVFNEGIRMIYMAMAVRTVAYSLGAWLRAVSAPAAHIAGQPQ